MLKLTKNQQEMEQHEVGELLKEHKQQLAGAATPSAPLVLPGAGSRKRKKGQSSCTTDPLPQRVVGSWWVSWRPGPESFAVVS